MSRVIATVLLFSLASVVPAWAALDGAEAEGLKLVNSAMVQELRTRASRLGTAAGNADTTYVGYTPGAPGAGGANYWSIYAGWGKDGYYRPTNGQPHKGTWDWETPVHGDSLQGWWPLRDVYITTGGVTLSDRNRPWWAIDSGNQANYRINGSSGRTFGVIGVWHRDGGSLVPGPVLSPLWTPPSGSHAAWMGLRAHGDASYSDAATGNAFNEDVLTYSVYSGASASGNDWGFPGYGSQLDQMLYRDLSLASAPTANLTVRFKFQTVMSTGFGTTASTRTGWFDCCPVGVTNGGGALPANQRNNFISSTDAGDALAPRDSFMVYIGRGVEATDLWTDPTGAQSSVYDEQRRWFGEVLKWDRDPGSNPANPQPLHYRQLLSVAGNWPAASGFVDTTFVIPNAVIAPLLSDSARIRLVFRVKTNRGFDDQGTAYSSGRKGAAVVDRVSYTLGGGPEVVFGDFENASDLDNATSVSALDAWKSTGKPTAIYDHTRLLSDLVYDDLCGQKGDVSRICNMSGVVISAGDFDNSEAAGGLVDGTAERERRNGIMSPTISLADDDGNPNTKNLHGLYGIGGNGGVGDVDPSDDFYVVYEIYTGIFDPFTQGNTWGFSWVTYPSNAKASYGYPSWSQLRSGPFTIFNPYKQCFPDIEGFAQNGFLRTSNPTGIPDSVRVYLKKTQQCFRFGVSTGCSPTDGCYWDNVTFAVIDGTPAAIGVQIWDWYQDAFPANETAGFPGVAALFDTTSALVKTGLNIAQSTSNTLRHCVPGDSVTISSGPTTSRVDLVFRILPGPGNYQPIGRPDLGTLRRVPSSTATITKGDGSFWDEYRQVPGDFASPSAVMLHHNAEGGWDANVWNSARCDTAEVNLAALQGRGVLGGPGANTNWMSNYHESDPHFSTLGVTKNVCYVRCLACPTTDIRCDGGQPVDYVIPATTTKEFSKIIPDGILTPGAHVEYFFRSQNNDVTPGVMAGTIPDTNVVFPQVAEGSSDGHRWQEFGVLPNRWKESSYRHPVTRLFGAGPACLLVVDNNDRRGNERVWVSMADSMTITPQRYWGAHNGWHAVGNGDLNDPADNRRGSDALPGFVAEHLGQAGSGGGWDMYQVKASESLTTQAGSIGGRLAYRGGSALVANKTSRQGPTPEMLAAYYSMVLFLSGDLNNGVLGPFTNRSQNDVGLLANWLQSGSTTEQNRGFWAIGDGFVESSWFTSVGSIQNQFLANFLGVGLSDPDYTILSGNSDELLSLRVHPEWQDKQPGQFSLYGIRNSCLWTNDVLDTDGIGLTLGVVTSNYERRSDGTAAFPSGVFKDWDFASPWKSLVDGWDLEHLTSAGDVNTLARASYGIRTVFNVWSKLCNLPFYDGCLGNPDCGDISDGGLGGSDFLRLLGNPASNGRAVIQLGLARGERADIRLYDVSGRLVRILANRVFTAGQHTLTWDGLDDTGHRMSRGIYFARVRYASSGFEDAKKLVVLRD